MALPRRLITEQDEAGHRLSAGGLRESNRLIWYNPVFFAVSGSDSVSGAPAPRYRRLPSDGRQNRILGASFGLRRDGQRP
ncbi:MAG: hypothetical protein AMJ59_10970 [Gammaproteobacteria bacterium SG8_31]|nr:MAG: hypothetical protein AMJ59_10970 [Gammaproteobacteria bacterium SG8_31]